MTNLIEPGDSSGGQLNNLRGVGDVFCPFFEVVFTNNRGTVNVRRDLVSAPNPFASLIVSLTAGRPAEPDFVSLRSETPEEQQNIDTAIKSIASMTVESNAGSPFKLTLDLTPTYEDGVRLLESGVITFQTTVTARWGYVTGDGGITATDYHYFTVNEPKASFGEDMRITIVAYDFTTNTASRRTTNRQWSRTTYARDLDILAAICGKSGYTLRATSIIFNTTINNPRTTRTVTGDNGSVAQLGTDWQFFKSICRKHGVAFYVAGREVVLFDPLNPPPAAEKLVYKFKWRRALYGTHDIPVYSIAGAILPSAFLPPAAGGVFALMVDNTTGKTSYVLRDGRSLPASREASAASEASVRGNTELMSMINSGRVSTNQVVQLPGSGTAVPDPPRDANEPGVTISLTGRDAQDVSEAIADNLVREASFFSNPRVKIRCPGVVDLHTEMLVTVEGTGKIYDYTYTVHAVRHILGNNGYDMEVDLMRQGNRMTENVPNAPPQETRTIPTPSGPGNVPETTTLDTPRSA